MSEQPETTAEEGDGKGMCCKSWSSTSTKCGYYLTFAAGLVIFVVGIVDLLELHVHFLIIGSLIILLCPLWIKDCSACLTDLKNPMRLSSTLIFLLFLGLTITIQIILDSKGLTITCGICLGISGIWYFLSFFETGQKACISCLKGCCCSEKE